MNRKRTRALNLAAVVVVFSFLLSPCILGCSREAAQKQQIAVSVTTSWLECAARDIAGPKVVIRRIMPPGGCPGHFDLSPTDVTMLAGCALLLRFDFQSGLDVKLDRLKSAGLRVEAISAPGGLSAPATYEKACEQTAEALIRSGIVSENGIAANLNSLRTRMAALSNECRKTAEESKFSELRVFCSNHQADFCRWLGMSVAATFDSGAEADISEVKAILDEAEKAPAHLIVANLQQGRRFADALAPRLGVPVAVLSNFPAMDERQKTFDDLVRANVQELLRCRKSQ
ncbi:MAG TPA: metal ABC transporter substrate-binding protein [Candidatus Brocadiia bacterium]|nr:metal ABC transporter substrate-binding protein [Candidatus Brocadiia bacterium]